MKLHTHQRLHKNILPSITFKKFETVSNSFKNTIIGLKRGVTKENKIYFVFESDHFIINKAYKNLSKFKLKIPYNFDDPENIEELEFVSNYPQNPLISFGKLCSQRIASFYSDKKLTHLLIGDKYYIPMEGTYDYKDDCKCNHGGLSKNEIHGYFIVLSEIEFLGFQLKFNKNSSFGTKVCPGIRSSSGIYKYEYNDLNINI